MVDTDKLKDIAREYLQKGSIKKMGDEGTSTSVLIPLCEFMRMV
jgi:hypothetical protein